MSAAPVAVEERRQAPPARMSALDGLRGIAIVLVLLYHFAEGLDGLPAAEAFIYNSLRTGWVGVDLFFVLSGFLITGILHDSKADPRYFFNFYARRSLRIFPLYYGFLFAIFVILPQIRPFREESMIRTAANQWWLWCYGTNFAITFWPDQIASFRHFWSLAVEEHFYLFWPLVIYYTSRRRGITACLICIGLAAVLRVALVAAGVGHPAAYILTPCRLDALATGGLIALLIREHGGTERLLVWARRLAPLTALCIAVLFGFTELQEDHPVVQTIGYPLLEVFFGSILVMLVSPRQDSSPLVWLHRIANNRILKMFGMYSYAIYVFHRPLHGLYYKIGSLSFLGLENLTGSRLLALAPFLVTGPALALLTGMLSWHLFEKHFVSLKHRFEFRSPARGAGVKSGAGVKP